VSEGRQEIRFFTDTFHFEHEVGQDIKYRLIRRIPDSTAIQRVVVNGKPTEFSRGNGVLTLETRMIDQKDLNVQVLVQPAKPDMPDTAGLRYQTSVAIRRVLSEVRDNVLSRNDLALKTGRSVMRFLKQTAG
jgi:hypothetical protein